MADAATGWRCMAYNLRNAEVAQRQDDIRLPPEGAGPAWFNSRTRAWSSTMEQVHDHRDDWFPQSPRGTTCLSSCSPRNTSFCASASALLQAGACFCSARARQFQPRVQQPLR